VGICAVSDARLGQRLAPRGPEERETVRQQPHRVAGIEQDLPGHGV
jgi:hypothetical protein